MKEEIKFALRHNGTSEFATACPHDFYHFVNGWDWLEEKGALVFETREEAEAAKSSDPDGYALTVEEIR